MNCPQCGVSNRETAKFCNKCGAAMRAPSAVRRNSGAEPRLGELTAVPIVRKRSITGDPQLSGAERAADLRPPVPVPSRMTTHAANQPTKGRPHADLAQPFFTSFVPAQKNKQHQRLVLVTAIILILTAAVFALAYYAFIKY